MRGGDELAKMDRQWADMKGWPPPWPSVTTSVDACFGPGGPWEYLRSISCRHDPEKKPIEVTEHALAHVKGQAS